MKILEIISGILTIGFFILMFLKGSAQYLLLTYISGLFFLIISEVNIYLILRKDKDE